MEVASRVDVPAPHTLDLGHGIELRCSMPALDDSVEVALVHRGHALIAKVFRADDPHADFTLATRLLRADAGLSVDAFTGEVAWRGHLEVRRPFGRWHRLLGDDHGVLARVAPAIGEVGGRPGFSEPVVDHPRFGRSQLCTPAVLRIFVDEEDRLVADVGRLVKRTMFPDHPPFVFNTVACVGAVEPGAPGLYPDPASDWFNVFFGYYQLDCPKDSWTRPFGYRSADGVASRLEPEDVVRLGKSDWNWFSNWMYGVPTADVLPYSDPDMDSIEVVESPPERIGRSLWHGLTLRGVEVASTYESDAEDAARLVRNTIIDDVWRRSFGLPSPQPDFRQSFIPTRIVAQVDMAYWEGEDAFHTLILGGTAPLDADPAFLAAQMAAVRSVIESDYARLGFDPA